MRKSRGLAATQRVHMPVCRTTAGYALMLGQRPTHGEKRRNNIYPRHGGSSNVWTMIFRRSCAISNTMRAGNAIWLGTYGLLRSLCAIIPLSMRGMQTAPRPLQANLLPLPRSATRPSPPAVVQKVHHSKTRIPAHGYHRSWMTED